MCGLLGLIDIARLQSREPWSPADLGRFDGIRDLMHRRGPDGAGTWSEAGLLLGHRRLAILDLSDAAAQPMLSAAGTVLVLNGEIYNYVELRAELAASGEQFRSSGDTAVLLAALDRWGLDETLKRVRGMFAFAAWRPRERELWLARDPAGKKPLFLGRAANQIAFGSSLESVVRCLAGSGLRPRLDPVAVNHALASGWVPAPRTGLRDIRKMRAGTRLVLSADGGEAERQYWRVSFPENRQSLDRSRIDQLQGLFDQAVRRRLRSDVPVATFLSGGLDSSLVTAAASRLQPGIVAYTARTRSDNDDEFRLATAIARHLDIEHRVIDINADMLDGVDDLVSRHGELFCDSSAIPTAAICREAGRDYRVILTGDGGDEVQGGYTTATLFALRSRLPGGDALDRPSGALRAAVAHALEDARARLEAGLPAWRFRLLRLLAPPHDALALRHDGLDQSASLLQPAMRASLGDAEWRTWMRHQVSGLGAPTGLDAQLGFDFTAYLADDLNVKVDVSAMAASLEARCPLLDLDFVDACWNIRTLDRVRPTERKRVIQALAARYLPDSLLIRRKQGFSVPMGRWLESTGMDRQVGEALRAGRFGLGDLLDESRVADVLEANRRAGRNPAELTWRLLVLGRWANWVQSLASTGAAA